MEQVPATATHKADLISLVELNDSFAIDLISIGGERLLIEISDRALRNFLL